MENKEEKGTYYIPYEPGMSNFDMCICANKCKKQCLRNQYQIIRDPVYTASYLGPHCRDYEPVEDNKTDN